jgi:integrase
MPRLTESRVPSCRFHKQSGQALVTLNGRDICLGKHGTPQSKPEYNRLLAEWLSNGRFLPPSPQVITVLEVAEFGPLCLKAVREKMIEKKWCRKSVNDQTARIKHVFKWAVENELVPPSIYHGLIAVAGLKVGRSGARESAPVRPVSQEQIDAILKHVSRQVSAMIRLQFLTGMRPGEVCAMREIDMDSPDVIGIGWYRR